MRKKLYLIILFLLAAAGLKAQTYCYHCYKKYDKFDVPESKDFYVYITFKGDLMYFSEKDGGYQINSFTGKRKESLYKFSGYNDDALVYPGWRRCLNATRWVNNEYEFSNTEYFLVTKDKTEINYVFTGTNDNPEACTFCYKKSPNEDCEKPHVPAMKH